MNVREVGDGPTIRGGASRSEWRCDTFEDELTEDKAILDCNEASVSWTSEVVLMSLLDVNEVDVIPVMWKLMSLSLRVTVD